MQLFEYSVLSLELLWSGVHLVSSWKHHNSTAHRLMLYSHRFAAYFWPYIGSVLGRSCG